MVSGWHLGAVLLFMRGIAAVEKHAGMESSQRAACLLGLAWILALSIKT